jgi:hypothetical protein
MTTPPLSPRRDNEDTDVLLDGVVGQLRAGEYARPDSGNVNARTDSESGNGETTPVDGNTSPLGSIRDHAVPEPPSLTEWMLHKRQLEELMATVNAQAETINNLLVRNELLQAKSLDATSIDMTQGMRHVHFSSNNSRRDTMFSNIIPPSTPGANDKITIASPPGDDQPSNDTTKAIVKQILDAKKSTKEFPAWQPSKESLHHFMLTKALPIMEALGISYLAYLVDKRFDKNKDAINAALKTAQLRKHITVGDKDARAQEEAIFYNLLCKAIPNAATYARNIHMSDKKCGTKLYNALREANAPPDAVRLDQLEKLISAAAEKPLPQTRTSFVDKINELQILIGEYECITEKEYNWTKLASTIIRCMIKPSSGPAWHAFQTVNVLTWMTQLEHGTFNWDTFNKQCMTVAHMLDSSTQQFPSANFVKGKGDRGNEKKKWCDFHHKWCSHSTEECEAKKRHANKQNHGDKNKPKKDGKKDGKQYDKQEKDKKDDKEERDKKNKDGIPPGIICKYCKKTGHMMSNCPKRRNDEENDGSINFTSCESSSINFVSRESTELNAEHFIVEKSTKEFNIHARILSFEAGKDLYTPMWRTESFDYVSNSHHAWLEMGPGRYSQIALSIDRRLYVPFSLSAANNRCYAQLILQAKDEHPDQDVREMGLEDIVDAIITTTLCRWDDIIGDNDGIGENMTVGQSILESIPDDHPEPPSDAQSWAAYLKNGGLLDLQGLISAELYFKIKIDIISLVNSEDPCQGWFRPVRPACPVAQPHFALFTLFNRQHFNSLVAVTPDPVTGEATNVERLPFAVPLSHDDASPCNDVPTLASESPNVLPTKDHAQVDPAIIAMGPAKIIHNDVAKTVNITSDSDNEFILVPSRKRRGFFHTSANKSSTTFYNSFHALQEDHSFHALQEDSIQEMAWNDSCVFAAGLDENADYLILDSGCTHTILSNADYLIESVPHRQRLQTAGKAGSLWATAKGNAHLFLEDTNGQPAIVTVPALLCPDAHHSLISAHDLLAAGWRITLGTSSSAFKQDPYTRGFMTKTKHGTKIAIPILRNGNLLVFKESTPKVFFAATPGISHAGLQHLRCGHLNCRQIGSLPNNRWIKNVAKFSSANVRPCWECTRAKARREARGQHGIHLQDSAQAPLDLVTIDLAGPFRVHATTHDGRRNTRFFMLLIDVATKKKWVRPLATKSDSASSFRKWIIEVHSTSSPHLIKRVHSDQGLEFKAQAFKNVCDEFNIHQTFANTYTPESNGFSERAIGTVTRLARANLASSQAPSHLWFFAVQFSVDCLNTFGTTDGPPPDVVFHQKDAVDATPFVPFGAKAFAWRDRRTSEDPKLGIVGWQGIVVGLATCIGQRGHVLYIPEGDRIVISSHVRIDMNFFPFRPPPSRRITQEFFDGPDPVHLSAEAPAPYDDVFHPIDGQDEGGELNEGGEPGEGGVSITQDSVFSRRPSWLFLSGPELPRNFQNDASDHHQGPHDSHGVYVAPGASEGGDTLGDNNMDSDPSANSPSLEPRDRQSDYIPKMSAPIKLFSKGNTSPREISEEEIATDHDFDLTAPDGTYALDWIDTKVKKLYKGNNRWYHGKVRQIELKPHLSRAHRIRYVVHFDEDDEDDRFTHGELMKIIDRDQDSIVETAAAAAFFASDIVEETDATASIIPDVEDTDATTVSDNDQDIIPTRKLMMQRPDRDEFLKAEEEELASMQEKEVFKVVPDQGQRTLGSKFTYRVKRDGTGKIVRYKARLVARGFLQVKGIDFDESSSPVSMMASFRLFMAWAVLYSLNVIQGDIKTAYLNAELDRVIYMRFPEGYKGLPGHILKLQRSIYGCRQSGRQWFYTLAKVMRELGYVELDASGCFWQRANGPDLIHIVLIYVDDFVSGYTDSAKWLHDQLLEYFQKEWGCSNIGPISFHLGIQVTYEKGKGAQLHQKTYLQRVLQRFFPKGLNAIKEGGTPLDYINKIDDSTCPETPDPEIKRQFQEIFGCILYASCNTRPDLAVCMTILGRYMANPGAAHLTAIKRVLRYIAGSLDRCIEYKNSNYKLLSGEVINPHQLINFTDADWAGDADRRLSTSGTITMLAGGPVSWRSQTQKLQALSSMESELIASCEGAKDIMYFRNTFAQSHFCSSQGPTPMYIDNSAVLDATGTEGINQRTKHIAMRYFYVRSLRRQGEIKTIKCLSAHNASDILTKITDGKTLTTMCSFLMRTIVTSSAFLVYLDQETMIDMD